MHPMTTLKRLARAGLLTPEVFVLLSGAAGFVLAGAVVLPWAGPGPLIGGLFAFGFLWGFLSLLERWAPGAADRRT